MASQLLLTGALAVLIWSGIVLARASLVGTALAVLLVGSCVSDSLLRVELGPVPLSAEHLLLAVLVAQYATYRRWGQVRSQPVVTTDYVLVGLLLVLVASTFLHDYRADRFRPLLQLASFYMLPAVIYWMVRRSEWTARTAWCVLGTLGAFGIYLSAAVVAESRGAWNLVLASGVAVPEFIEYLGRGRGLLSQSAAVGLLLTLATCAALAFWPRASRGGKLLLSVLVAAILVGIYSTHSLSAWLGAGGALVLTVVLSASRVPRLRVVAAAATVAAVVVGVGWQQFHTERGNRAASAKAATPAESPSTLAVVAWHMYLDHPILGCGLGQYVREAPAYLANHTDTPLAEQSGLYGQNVFLSLLAETGFLGMGLFVALLLCWTGTAWQLWRAATAPLWARQMGVVFLAFMMAYLAGGMFHDLSKAPMVNMFLFFLGGTVTGLSALLDGSEAVPSLPRTRPREEPVLVAGS